MIELIPADLLVRLEFDQIRSLLAAKCYGEPGAARCRRLSPVADYDTIVTALDEVQAFRDGMERNALVPLGRYESIDDDLSKLEIESYVLSLDAVVRIANVLRLAHGIVGYFTPERQEEYAPLWRLVADLEPDGDLLAEIDRIIDEEGQVRPDASPELVAIERQKNARTAELASVFQRLIRTLRQQQLLSESVESFRNGRRVLAVPAEHKRKVKGIIHDESTTGKTVFIEPEAAILLNNELFDLEVRRQEEIYRLLADLSGKLRGIISGLRSCQDVVVHLDVVQAKAALALRMDAARPFIQDKPGLGIRQGRHPLLYLKNKSENKKTVPFDLELHRPNRILVISGPNAGGKSVTMKAVGLLQLMVQAGLHVPADSRSTFGIFRKVFADIGDQQSIEDDLSTYSSRLRNMNDFVRRADARTLVLIDEFGSGTDPKIGGAIAEALLRTIHQKKVFGVLTTHYPNLKIFAFRTRGLLNGAMVFDREKLTPTYELKIGRPGSSFAFEVAAASGLDEDILRYARKRAGKNTRETDELLIALQQEKAELEEKLRRVKEREEEVDRLIKAYNAMKDDLDFKRRKIKLASKEQDLQTASAAHRQVQELIRQLREEKNLEKAKAIASQIRAQREQIAREVKDLNDAMWQAPDTQRAIRQIRPGTMVRFRAGGAMGRVEEVRNKTVVMRVGEMRVTAKLSEVVAVEGEPIRRPSFVKTNLKSQEGHFETELDLRGMAPLDAAQTLEKFIDRAILTNTHKLRIIHGKGTGRLRRLVREQVKPYEAMISRVFHPAPELGGDGVTIIEIKN